MSFKTIAVVLDNDDVTVVDPPEPGPLWFMKPDGTLGDGGYKIRFREKWVWRATGRQNFNFTVVGGGYKDMVVTRFGYRVKDSGEPFVDAGITGENGEPFAINTGFNEFVILDYNRVEEEWDFVIFVHYSDDEHGNGPGYFIIDPELDNEGGAP